MNRDLSDRIRILVYEYFVDNCEAPTVADLASTLSLSILEAKEHLQSLFDEHILVLDPQGEEIRMAMPFSAIPTPFEVCIDEKRWYANCAWDALGIPAMLGKDALLQTTCMGTGEDIEIAICDDVVHGSDELIHFALPARQWWDDIYFT